MDDTEKVKITNKLYEIYNNFQNKEQQILNDERLSEAAKQNLKKYLKDKFEHYKKMLDDNANNVNWTPTFNDIDFVLNYDEPNLALKNLNSVLGIKEEETEMNKQDKEVIINNGLRFRAWLHSAVRLAIIDFIGEKNRKIKQAHQLNVARNNLETKKRLLKEAALHMQSELNKVAVEKEQLNSFFNYFCDKPMRELFLWKYEGIKDLECYDHFEHKIPTFSYAELAEEFYKTHISDTEFRQPDGYVICEGCLRYYCVEE